MALRYPALNLILEYLLIFYDRLIIGIALAISSFKGYKDNLNHH